MKQRLYLILLLAAVTLSGMAQAVGDAFYIYRNDGKFNAFFRDEVDSITYSHYDADSVYYDEMVTQLVHTQDSVYFIPLAAIDSVGFVQPETKLQPNVVEMEKKGLTDYLVSVEGMTLFFKSSIPNDLKPKTGDVLITTEFNSPLLPDGFVGKVQATKMQTDAYRVDCDSIYDIFDIFEQLISIEKIEDNQTNAARRVKGEWISSRNPLEFNLGYTKSTSKANVSLSGSVNGSYIATVAYNITRKEQYINLRIDHDWNYGTNLKVDTDKTGGSFGPLKGPVLSLPSVRFAYIFKFQISGAPFIKGEGNIEAALSLNSPTHSYITEATFHNGKFSGTNRKKNVSGGNKPSFETAFSLNGSVQAGYMADFWLGVDSDIKGIAKDVLKLGTTLDFYIGPKINGNFTMKLGTDAPNNYYSVYKDSKLGISLLTFDYEFSGEASLAGRKFPKGVFCNGTLQTPLYHEWYIMPEFSDLEIAKDEKNLSATITCTPTRDIAFPLGLGIGLYDEENQLKEISFEASNYKRENEGFVINQTFPSLEREKVYEARPMIKILGGEVSATPTKTFKLEKNITVLTLSSNSLEGNSAIVRGRVQGFISGLDDGEVGFFYNTTGNPSLGNGQSVVAGKLSNFADGEFLSILSGLEQGKTYYYCAYLYSEGKYIYGEVKSFKTKIVEHSCPDSNHPHWIDLGLPSGTKWRCCNEGASTPEAYGNYYTFGQVGSAPSLTQIKELQYHCKYQWTTQNRVNGGKFTGPNGGTIFLPAAGYRWLGEFRVVGSTGYYWSSTPGGGGNACGLGFGSGGSGWYNGNLGRDYEFPVRSVR